jgi:hypothetical protein
MSSALRNFMLALTMACAGTQKTYISPESELPPANCPKLTEKQVEAFSKYSASHPTDSSPHALYMSFVVDGERATINVPTFQYSEAPLFHPSINHADIVSMTPLSPSEGARWYRPCPGVQVVLIRTKSGNWRPENPNHQ